MLRFSYSRPDRGERWTLSGDLSGPWVEDLRAVWRRIREQAAPADAVVDLKDVTFIDESGESLLAEMKRAGAKLIACGVEHTHLVANLNGEGGRTLRRRLEHLCCGEVRSAGNPATAESAREASAGAERKTIEKP
jgi:hypothetical protein